jgi:hypothetical protein
VIEMQRGSKNYLQVGGQFSVEGKMANTLMLRWLQLAWITFIDK